MKLGCCIEMLYTDRPIEQRIGAAASTGFAGVEFWGWENKDLPALGEAAQRAGIAISDCCIGTRDAAKASQYKAGAMLVRQNSALYAEMVEETIEAVAPLGIRTLIATTGQALPDRDRISQHEAVVACLQAAAPVLDKHGFTIVLEPLNILVNHKGYYLDTSDQAFTIVSQVGSERVKVLYDIYHQQITEGNLIQTLTGHIGQIGHFHLADVPGRHEPGTGEINYQNVLRAIESTGYTGWVGCEYSPSAGKTAHDSAQLVMSYVRNLV